jgi:kynurenine formamidase
MTRLIDLTMELSARTPVYPGDAAPQFGMEEQVEKTGWNVRSLVMTSHLGTHVDAPYHMFDDGKTLDDFPLETFSGPLAVVDVVGQSVIHGDALPETGDASVVLLRTDHSKKAYTPEYHVDNPVIDETAAIVLVQRGVRVVGIDSYSVDNPPHPVHRTLLSNNVLILENLVNLDQVTGRTRLFVGPLKLARGDGAPARVWAEVYS